MSREGRGMRRDRRRPETRGAKERPTAILARLEKLLREARRIADHYHEQALRILLEELEEGEK